MAKNSRMRCAARLSLSDGPLCTTASNERCAANDRFRPDRRLGTSPICESIYILYSTRSQTVMVAAVVFWLLMVTVK